MILLSFALIGALAGLLSGMFGIGGGLVIVPVLLTTFKGLGMSAEVSMHLALGTSLASIVVTSTSSAWAHHRQTGIDWQVLFPLAIALVIGAAMGGYFAGMLSGEHLQSLFAVFLLAIASYMWWGKVHADGDGRPSRKKLGVFGLGIGATSALFGIGGGMLTTPSLSYLGLNIKKALALSAACGVPIAIAGSISYLFNGWGLDDLPKWSLGFIYLPAWLGITLVSPWFARWGAKLTARFDARRLKQAFALLLLVVAGNLLLF